MTDALYDDLCDAVKAVCLHLDAFSHQSAPLGYHRWARAFVAGVYSRKTAERALDLALPGAAFNDESDAHAVLARAAASAVAVAVLNAIDGDETRAQRIAQSARVIVDLLGYVAADERTYREDRNDGPEKPRDLARAQRVSPSCGSETDRSTEFPGLRRECVTSYPDIELHAWGTAFAHPSRNVVQQTRRTIWR